MYESVIAILLFVIVLLLLKIKNENKKFKNLKSKYTKIKWSLYNLPTPVFVKKHSKIIYTNQAFDIAFGTNKIETIKLLSKMHLKLHNYIDLEFDNKIRKSTLIFTKSKNEENTTTTIGAIFDINDFKTENNNLKKTKERLELAIRGSNSGVWDWDIQNDTFYFSNRWKEIMGYNKHEKADNINSWLDLIDPRDLYLVNEGITKALNSEKESLDITYRTRLDYPPRWINVKGKALFDKGVAIRLTGLISDVTQKKLKERELDKSKRLFATFMDNLPAVAFIKDKKNRYIYLNNFYENYIGFKVWENKTPYDLFSKEVANIIVENDRKAFYEGIKKHEEVIPNEEGSLRYFESYKFPIEDDDGNKLLCGFGIDKTKEKIYQERMNLYAKIFDNTTEAIMITDKNGKIVSVNKAFEEITEYKKDEIIGKTPKIIKSNLNQDSFFKNMWESLNKYGHFSGEIYNISKSGKILPQLTSISSIKNKKGEVIFYFAIYQSIAKQKETEEKLRKLANYDTLTNLPNRFLFEDRLKNTLLRVQRFDIKIALVFIDLDDFKWVNDTLGHEAGDTVLKVTAKKLLASVRENDTVARLGGDEFVAILEDIKDKENVRNICNKMLSYLNEPFMLEDKSYTINASIGASLAPDDATTYNDLLKKADEAMYKSKQNGKNKVFICK